MSTDSTELTFVRCPSCRSLVPAMSTRCRMCGATLDAQGKQAEDPDKDKKSSRVRQRTMSSSGTNELSSAVSQLREQLEGEPPTAPEGAGADDPLGPYIEEVQSGESARQEAAATPVPLGVTGEIQLLDPIEADPAPPVAAPLAGPRPESVVMKSTPAEAPPAATPTPPPAEAEEKPRVIVESGGRRFGKPSGLSFGKREEGSPERPAAEERRAPEERRAEPPAVRQREEPPANPRANERGFGERPQPKRIEVNDGGQRPDQKQGRPEQPQQRPERQQEKRRDEGPNQRQEQRHDNRQEHRQENRPENRQEHRRDDSRRDDRSRPPQGQNSPAREVKPAAARPREMSGPKRNEGEAGRLCGWLVSYVDPNGAAIELREGKFFVSRSSLKPTDLIIEEDSISTPHALITVVGGNALHIQDLMSERGVFTRRRGADAYLRIDENVEVEHGDWIRFGDVEFLVSMIAHVGALGE